jgi:hypothetical protein
VMLDRLAPRHNRVSSSSCPLSVGHTSKYRRFFVVLGSLTRMNRMSGLIVAPRGSGQGAGNSGNELSQACAKVTCSPSA